MVSGRRIAWNPRKSPVQPGARIRDLSRAEFPVRLCFTATSRGSLPAAWDTASHLPPNVSSLWILKKIQPAYPDTALRANLEGKVILAVCVDKEGSVGKMIPLLATAGCFVETTVEALAHWKFSPPVKDCEALSIWVNVEFSFILENGTPVVVMPE